jgi:streptogramin lyase
VAAASTGGSVIASIPNVSLLPGTETPITRGPDGALWFPLAASTQPNIVRVSSSGQVNVFALPFAFPNPTYSQPVTDLAAGPDGTLWYVRGSAVGKIKLPSGLDSSDRSRRL